MKAEIDFSKYMDQDTIEEMCRLEFQRQAERFFSSKMSDEIFYKLVSERIKDSALGELDQRILKDINEKELYVSQTPAFKEILYKAILGHQDVFKDRVLKTLQDDDFHYEIGNSFTNVFVELIKTGGRL